MKIAVVHESVKFQTECNTTLAEPLLSTLARDVMGWPQYADLDTIISHAWA